MVCLSSFSYTVKSQSLYCISDVADNHMEAEDIPIQFVFDWWPDFLPLILVCWALLWQVFCFRLASSTCAHVSWTDLELIE
jgi:hypothetical protein